MDRYIEIGDKATIPVSELEFNFSRSGGPGGQRANRTATRVELLYDIENASTLTDAQRDLLLRKLGHHTDSDGVLHLVSQGTASQWRNRKEVIERFKEVLEEGLETPSERVSTRVPQRAKERRLHDKHHRSRLKEQRKSVDPTDY
ncbi:MAG: alternative ribosome rescue aminoacyl-tRNA hydrolase ArfB [Anaerolineales bacterium]